MLTRAGVTAQYDHEPGAAPPRHVAMHHHQHAPGLTRQQMYGGGLMGGAVQLTTGGPTGMRAGDTGYGYLGMDPSSPDTWTRKFNPAPGMIGRLNLPGEFSMSPAGPGQAGGAGG